MDLESFNAAPVAEARDILAACADVPWWIERVLDGRPFASVDNLHGRALTLAEEWNGADVAAALAHHPRIGSAGNTGGSGEQFSAEEQSGVGAQQRDAWAEANRRYEEKFDQIFLIRAAGRSSAEMLAALEKRLDNDPATEASVRCTQLRQIMLLRLQRSVTRKEETLRPVERSFVTTHVLDTTHGCPAAGVAVELCEADGRELARATTDDDGRIATLGPTSLVPGRYRLTFDLATYWAGHNTDAFYPKVELTFTVSQGQAHYHVPLLISPWSISSYRGS